MVRGIKDPIFFTLYTVTVFSNSKMWTISVAVSVFETTGTFTVIFGG
jgi:hypothetical protein